ncbi:hypothetical protein BGZ63DRAFT_245711 [Mariannaea sp. PMI_226]|nr:hypothetical protein BGZ63DRAFT_245711 [Mariannaea sp. PMI_226]
MSLIRHNHISSYPEHEKHKVITSTYDPYPTPSPTVMQEDVINKENPFNDRQASIDLGMALSPTFEHWWPLDCSAFGDTYYTGSNGMAAMGGHPSNNHVLCEYPFKYQAGYSTGFSTPPEYLSNYMNASDSNTMSYPNWENVGTAYVGSAVPDYEEGFANELTSPLGPPELPQNRETDIQSSNKKGKQAQSESSSDQAASPGHSTSGKHKNKKRPRRKSKNPTGQNNHSEEFENLRVMEPALPRETEDYRQFQHEENDYVDRNKRFQRRNRVASNKFRVKKKQDIRNLQAEEEQLREEHVKLKSEASALRSHVTELKSNLLSHSQCDCSMIQDYINSQASSFVHNRVGMAAKRT